jgi:ribulose-5-phosphate 4-epimerase/fuculose-1-phosphate aldolase
MSMQADNTFIEAVLGRAAAKLAAKEFLTPGDTLSQRIPEQNAFVTVRIGDKPVFQWTLLSSTPESLHHRIYLARPDVGAIAAGALPWTSRLARLELTMPAVFDEQVRHLGTEVKCVNGEGAIPPLSNGANAYCLNGTALSLGMNLERLLPNIEILEKCAESFILARSTGKKVRRIPWLVRFIANGRLKKDRGDAARRHLRGERSVLKAGY